jgi:nitrate/nitrite transporter NarK
VAGFEVTFRGRFWVTPKAGAAAAGGIAFINGVGNLGGMVGPIIVGWLKDVTGSYKAGMLAMAAALAIAALLTLSLKLMVNEE